MTGVGEAADPFAKALETKCYASYKAIFNHCGQGSGGRFCKAQRDENNYAEASYELDFFSRGEGCGRNVAHCKKVKCDASNGQCTELSKLPRE